jgi:hypothetical protein
MVRRLAEKLLATLIELLSEQEGIIITYELEEETA